MRVESVTFSGVTFRRNLDAKQAGDRKYFKPHIGDIRRGVEALHREVYKKYHGPIPKGYDVHHKDENPNNNDPGNLEILPSREHRAMHGRRIGAAGRIAHARWLQSPAGKAWRIVSGKRAAKAYKQRKSKRYTCKNCGKKYWSKKPGGLFCYCSGACSMAARWKSGVDDVSRICEVCGESYRVNKYEGKRTCGYLCGGRLAAQTRRGRLRKVPDIKLVS